MSAALAFLLPPTSKRAEGPGNQALSARHMPKHRMDRAAIASFRPRGSRALLARGKKTCHGSSACHPMASCNARSPASFRIRRHPHPHPHPRRAAQGSSQVGQVPAAKRLHSIGFDSQRKRQVARGPREKSPGPAAAPAPTHDRRSAPLLQPSREAPPLRSSLLAHFCSAASPFPRNHMPPTAASGLASRWQQRGPGLDATISLQKKYRIGSKKCNQDNRMTRRGLVTTSKGHL